MHYNGRNSIGTTKRLASKSGVVSVNFICSAPEARHVSVIGDFNDWQPEANPMRRQPDGAWWLQLQISPGHHHYQVLVDGKPILDPRAQGVARNQQNQRVSLIAVS